MTEVGVVATGACNLASMLAALRRIGAAPRVIEVAEDLTAARLLVVPGVGAFGAVVAEIDRRGLRKALIARIRAGGATMAVCLGLQLLCESSEESPGVCGLGILPGCVTQLAAGLRVPQMGWNRIDASRECRIVTNGHAYFANSYRLTSVPDGWNVAISNYGAPFVAAIERGPIAACQFHPELSGDWGTALLQRLDSDNHGVPC